MIKKATLLLMLTTYVFLTNKAVAEIPQLISYWMFNEKFGRIAYDASGNEHHGKLAGSAAWMPSDGKLKGAVSLGGINNNGRVDIPVNELEPQEGTIALWAYIPQKSPSRVKNRKRYLFSYGNSPDAVQLYIDRSDTELDLGLGNQHKRHLKIASLKNNTWYHLAVSWRQGDYAVYVNGVLKAQGTYTGLTKSPLRASIGNNPRDRFKSFHGLIDDFAIFERALMENQVAELYKFGVKSLMGGPKLKSFIEAVQRADMILRVDAQEAVDLLETKIAEFETWKGTIANLGFPLKHVSFDLYSMLAKAKKAAGANIQDIAEAYKKLVSRPLPNTFDTVYALSWLSENISNKSYAAVIDKCVVNNYIAPSNIYYIIGNFEANGNQTAFKLFLDAVFSQKNPNPAYAVAIAAALKEDEVWSEKFLNYFRDKPELAVCFAAGYDKLAKKHIEQGKFSKAVEVYRDIVNRCSTDQDRAPYEFKTCRYLFDGGGYRNAITELERFIVENRTDRRDLVKEAALMKGQCHIQLDELDKALDEFLVLSIEYPESKHVPEANYLVGYCYMLLGKYKKATEIFNIVEQECPKSFYAVKANIYLNRIKIVTGLETQ
jgi:tetratricopeptide (TPR) repeat protein